MHSTDPTTYDDATPFRGNTAHERTAHGNTAHGNTAHSSESKNADAGAPLGDQEGGGHGGGHAVAHGNTAHSSESKNADAGAPPGHQEGGGHAVAHGNTAHSSGSKTADAGAAPTRSPGHQQGGHIAPLRLPPADEARMPESSSGNATASRVDEFVAQRKAEKDKVFSYVLSGSGRLFAGGTLYYFAMIAVSFANVLPGWMILIVGFPVNSAWAATFILLSTLPLDTWDFDATVDSLPAVRRIGTFGLFALFCSRAVAFPHIPGLLGMCVCVVKFVWEELDIGCCARSRKDTTASAGMPAGRCGSGRPRITTIFCIYWVVLAGVHTVTQNMFEDIPCHAGGGAVRNSTANTTNATNTTTATCKFGSTTPTMVEPDARVVPYLYIFSAWDFAKAVVVFLLYTTQRWRFHKRRGGWNPTLAFINVVYFYFVTLGISAIINGYLTAMLGKYMKLGIATCVLGVVCAAPFIVALFYGRKRLFKVIARKFEDKRRGRDGAVIAELMDNADIRVGKEWWVRHGKNLVGKYPGDDHRRNWTRGVIVEVQRDKYAVRLNVEQLPLNVATAGSRVGYAYAYTHGGSDKITAGSTRDTFSWISTIGSFQLSTTDLLKHAMDQLLLVDGQYVTHGLMAEEKKFGEASWAALDAVRKLRANEKYIDYFISHSWHDDATAQFVAIDGVKQQFKKRYGREATFWLDKVCLSQSNVSVALKVLCINVTSCNKLLVVCGKTYFQRLWCLLELFMMFAFADEENAVSRIELVPIEADGVTRESILDNMAEFKLDDAHCYDPNEEIKLRAVMAEVGEERFVGRIRALAGKIRARDVERAARGGRKVAPEPGRNHMPGLPVDASSAVCVVPIGNGGEENV